MSKVYQASVCVRGHLQTAWTTVTSDLFSGSCFEESEFFGEDDLTSPKQEPSVLRHRGYYSSCLRDKSCATACLTSQLGVVVFSFSFFVPAKLSASASESEWHYQLMRMWAKCLSRSADSAADFTVEGFQVWRTLGHAPCVSSVLFCTKQRSIESIETCCVPFSHSKQSKNWV